MAACSLSPAHFAADLRRKSSTLYSKQPEDLSSCDLNREGLEASMQLTPRRVPQASPQLAGGKQLEPQDCQRAAPNANYHIFPTEPQLVGIARSQVISFNERPLMAIYILIDFAHDGRLHFPSVEQLLFPFFAGLMKRLIPFLDLKRPPFCPSSTLQRFNIFLRY